MPTISIENPHNGDHLNIPAEFVERYEEQGWVRVDSESSTEPPAEPEQPPTAAPNADPNANETVADESAESSANSTTTLEEQS